MRVQPSVGFGMDGFLFNIFKRIGEGISNSFGTLKNNIKDWYHNQAEKMKSGAEIGELSGSGPLRNLINRYTGTGLTDAEKEANAFTHNERIEAQNWSKEMSDTQAQRAVADYEAAGINPMMLVSGGMPSTPSSSGGQSVNPVGGNLGSLLSMFKDLALIPSEIKLNKANAEAASARAKESEAKVPFWQMSTEQALQRIELMKAQIATEGSKSEFYEARSLLANVNAQNIQYLQEAIKNYYDASAKAQGANATLAEAQAFATFIHGLYENKLIDSGYIEQLVKRTTAETANAYSSAREHNANVVLIDKQGHKIDAEAEGQRISNALANGTFTNEYMSEDNVSWFDKFVTQGKRVTSMFGDFFNFSIGI